jgi:hypothetical protein
MPEPDCIGTGLERTTVRRFALAVVAAGAAVLSAPPLLADITVDGTACTLAQAVNAVNKVNCATIFPGPDVGSCAAASPGANTIDLTVDVPLTAVDNDLYGPDGLPPVASSITIAGNGHTISRSPSAPPFRFFYVSGGWEICAGSLTLENLTLSGGLAQGGGSTTGGGGMGAGGAIFNQGTLHLSGVTITNCTARGGTTTFTFAGIVHTGGGGMGADGLDAGGGFGGSFAGAGGPGGAGGFGGGGGGGGGGFLANAAGQPGSYVAGAGGGLGLFGGGGPFIAGDGAAGDGGGGGGPFQNPPPQGVPRAGGNFGYGGGFGVNGGGGGGGVGGGGGGSDDQAGSGGSGGFGGGGGVFGSGGFGGGGGLGNSNAGFGGGTGFTSGGSNGSARGGGGAGLGGAIFNMGASTASGSGVLAAVNTTMSGNQVQGGSVDAGNDSGGGSGFGAAIFNLDGKVTLTHCTIAGNTAAAGTGIPNGAADGAVYNLAYGNAVETGGATTASSTLVDTILAATTGGNDLVSSSVDGNQTNTATVVTDGHDIVPTSSGTISGSPLTGSPLLGPLQNNGGPTPTMALLAGSPALDAADPAACVPTDQRGVLRPQGPSCDIGAYEQGQLTVQLVGNGTGTVTSAPAGISCNPTCAASFPGTSVTLSAQAAAGSSFIAWTSNCVDGVYDFTSSHQPCAATFSLTPPPVAQIPTLGATGLLAVGLLLAAAGLSRIRRVDP